MEIHTVEDLARVLQACIAPVAMISGVGLLILSQTNRFSRVTDRLRELAQRSRASQATDALTNQQITIFHRRARILRGAIGAAVGCAFLASLEVLALFAVAVLGAPVHSLVLLLFALSLVSLILSLALFLVDMSLSLQAIQAELEQP
ncbi:MAG TPA: DUF2721 domain-containing protein [Verrucomicrobiae bacterium]|nr:DUF2721 domain-containing protein [Verrucomicrobiae bacterium]